MKKELMELVVKMAVTVVLCLATGYVFGDTEKALFDESGTEIIADVTSMVKISGDSLFSTTESLPTLATNDLDISIIDGYKGKIQIRDVSGEIVFETTVEKMQSIVAESILQATQIQEQKAEIDSLKLQLQQKDQTLNQAFSEIKSQTFSSVEKDNIINAWKVNAKNIISAIEKEMQSEKADYKKLIGVINQVLFQLMLQKENVQ